MIRKWWKEAIGYQIYPRSYLDTNHDGIGDIRGIIDKLDYIESLNVNLVWISPFYPSPLDDNGYDISDFKGVDPQLGTLEEVKELIEKAHAKGIRIILDCVLNQSSDEHPWFIESRSSKNNEKRDYYIWAQGKDNQPPNNWGSFFGESAWKYDKLTDEYYLKIFSDKMPDLNWSNPTLRQEMADIIRFWLDLGIDGFRMDAIAHLGKDMTLTDSTLESDERGIAYDWSKFSNRPQLFDYLQELHQKVFSHYDIVTIGEVGGGAKFPEGYKYTNPQNPSIDMVFNFDHTWHNMPYGYEVLTPEKFNTNVIALKEDLDYWIQNSQKHNIHPPMYWLNHDHPRVLSQYGSLDYHRESGSMLGMVLLSLPGTPFIYNGEEIGMTNVDYTNPKDFKDVNTRNYFKNNAHRLTIEQMMNHMRYTGRDNGHTPMQWNANQHAGFSTTTPYLKLVSNYTTINVQDQENKEKSILNTYRTMAKIRKDNIQLFAYGTFELIDAKHPDLFIFKRQFNQEKYILIANFRDYEVPYQLPKYQEVTFHNYDNLANAKLRPYEAILLKES
ncbi:MAG: alpha-glucosidase [Erysipelothrix sp.]|nr:alpha-glucosidase [Erysipelothrix sp.]